MKANALSRLADRLRLNAASMEHGSAEADIRAAADILDGVSDLVLERNRYNRICYSDGRGFVSAKVIVDVVVAAHLRAELLEQDFTQTNQKGK